MVYVFVGFVLTAVGVADRAMRDQDQQPAWVAWFWAGSAVGTVAGVAALYLLGMPLLLALGAAAVALGAGFCYPELAAAMRDFAARPANIRWLVKLAAVGFILLLWVYDPEARQALASLVIILIAVWILFGCPKLKKKKS